MTRYRHMQVGWAMLGMLGVSVVSVAVSIPRAGGRGRAGGTGDRKRRAVGGRPGVLQPHGDGGPCTRHRPFGLTPLRKRIRLADIASFEAVRNPWYFGWGIQRYGPGWLYNVSGFEAIEIVRTDGKELRIGTDDSQGLLRALSAAVGERSHAADDKPADIAPTWQ